MASYTQTVTVRLLCSVNSIQSSIQRLTRKAVPKGPQRAGAMPGSVIVWLEWRQRWSTGFTFCAVPEATYELGAWDTRDASDG